MKHCSYKSLLILLFLSSILVLYSCNGSDENNENEFTFEMTFGTSGLDTGSFHLLTKDGGYIIVGSLNTFEKVCLIKTDSNGNQEWFKTYTIDNSFYNHGKSIIQEIDGDYVITGYCQDDHYSSEIFLMRVDQLGNEKMQQTYRLENSLDDSWHNVNSMAQTSDGGFIICGYYAETYNVQPDILLIKIDYQGNIQWSKIIGNEYHDEGSCVITTDNGEIVVVGGISSQTTDIFLAKFTISGELIWEQTIGTDSLNENAFSVEQTFDNGFIITGRSQISRIAMLSISFVKTDSYGNVQWEKIFDELKGSAGFNVKLTNDGGYVATGRTLVDQKKGDVLLIKLDDNFNLEFIYTFGGKYEDYGNCIIESEDGEYVIVGDTFSKGLGSCDIWFFKTNLY